MAEPTQTISLNALAQLCNLDNRRIQQLAKEGVMQKADRGEYLLVQSVNGYIKYLQERSSSTVANHDLNVERARLTFHQANKTALEEQVLNGNLLDADEVAQEWGSLVSEVRSGLLGLPTRLAQVAISATSLREIENACRDEIYSVLESLSGSKDNYAETDQASDYSEPEAAATSDSLTVG